MVRFNILVQLCYPLIRKISASVVSRSSCYPSSTAASFQFIFYHAAIRRQWEKRWSWFSTKFGKHFLYFHWLLNKTRAPHLGIQSLYNMIQSLFPALLPYNFPPNSRRTSHSDLLHLPGLPGVFTILCQNILPPSFCHLTKFYSIFSANSALRFKVSYSTALLFISVLARTMFLYNTFSVFGNGDAWWQDGQGTGQVGCKQTGMQNSCRQTFSI